MDWKTRSTGAPSRIASICVVMWARTQLWVGMAKRCACVIDEVEQVDDGAEGVGDGVDADDGVAGAEQEAIDD